MTTLTQRAQGMIAQIALDGLARQIRKSEPHLTKEQAFVKAYTDPKNAPLRRAERNASYQDIGFDKELSVPVRESSPAESGAAYSFAMKAAERLHKIDPSKSISQHFVKIWEHEQAGEVLRKSDRRERRLPGPFGK
jgi:hypothetical protein